MPATGVGAVLSAAWLLVAAALLAVYELRRRRWDGRWSQWRRACWAGGVILLAIAGAGPIAARAGGHAWASVLQYSLLLYGVPPLFALGAPWALLRGPSVRSLRRSPRRGWPSLAAYAVVMIAWRLPVMVDAAARHPALLFAEGLTLVAGGWALWSALVGSAPVVAVPELPRRMALAAVAAWSAWAFAYIEGMSSRPFYGAFAARPDAIGGQELAVGIWWAASASALAPVVFVSMTRWLGGEHELGEAGSASLRRSWAGHGG